MDGFRYPQFCPLARAAEVLGPRWSIPLLRELMTGPQRFSDLRRRMGGSLSSSVLTERLAGLESQGLVRRRTLPPPASASVYELTDAGRGLEPALLELTRWGARFLDAPRPDDHVEADWMRLGLRAFASPHPTPDLGFRLVVLGPAPEPEILELRGGESGTRLEPVAEPHAVLRAPVLLLLGFLSRALPADDVLAHPDVAFEGDESALARLPELFEVPAPRSSAPEDAAHEPQGEPT
ncbi:MAG: helix-turn-helix domain-containing protein [Myxococcota bacterium]|nr:helix-turn-helix domain-containing protein [Myxococcota bacterium]